MFNVIIQIRSMIVGLVLNLLVAGSSRARAWLATQSTTTLLGLFLLCLVVAYGVLALMAAFRFPTTFGDSLSIRIPASPEKVWDHVQDIEKNPLSAQQRVKTTIFSESEWHEEIGDQEVLICRTVETHRPRKLVRECWAQAVSSKAKLVYLLEAEKEKDDGHATTITILRIFVTVETVWGSFLTPMIRLVLHYRPKIIQQVAQEYLQSLCRDLAVPYQEADAWE